MVCKYCVFATQHACRTKQLLNTLIFWHLSYTFSQRISAVQWVHSIVLFRAVPSPAQVWSVQLGVLLEDLPLHSDFVNCVLFSPSAPHILSAADNGIIKVSYSGYFWWGVATYLLSFHLCISVYSSDPLEREGVGGGAHEPVAVPQKVLSALHQEGGGVRTYHTLLQHQGEETGGGTLTVAHMANLGILHTQWVHFLSVRVHQQ